MKNLHRDRQADNRNDNQNSKPNEKQNGKLNDNQNDKPKDRQADKRTKRHDREKDRAKKSLPGDLKALIGRALLRLLPSALPAIIGTALNIYLLLFISRSMDMALKGQFASHLVDLRLPLIALLAAVPLDLLLSFCRANYVRQANLMLKTRYLRKVFKKNIHEFQEEHSARYLSNITHDMNNLQERFFIPIFDMMTSVFGIFGAAFALAMINWKLILAAVLIAAVLIFFSSRSGKGLQKKEGERSAYLEDYTVYIREVLSAFRIIRSNNLEAKVTEDFDEKSGKVQGKRYELDKAESRIAALNALFFGSVLGGLIIMAGMAVRAGEVSVGGILVTINSFGMMIQPLMRLTEMIPQIASSKEIFHRMEESLENREKLEETRDFPGFTKELLCRDLHFAYEENQVLNGASLRLEKGGKYLMVGPSGGGKSTILRLLRKYFPPQEGEILLDGVPLREIRSGDYYAHIANVEQHVFLFDDSLKNNLTLCKDYPEEELQRAIHASGLEKFVRSRAAGLEESIRDNGKNLSGGEKARIAIARALLSRSDIIFLDEAFASLDDTVARSIEKTLLELEDVTVLSISHVVFADTMPLYDKVFQVARGKVRLLEAPL